MFNGTSPMALKLDVRRQGPVLHNQLDNTILFSSHQKNYPHYLQPMNER